MGSSRLELAGSQVVLRTTVSGDVPTLRAVHATPEVGRWWGPPGPGFPLEEDGAEIMLTILVGGEVAGFLQATEELDPDLRFASVDLFVDPRRHRRGIATDAITAIIRHLVEERGHHRITIDPATENEAAIRCYEGVGFRRVGVMRSAWRDSSGRWRDGLLMELVVR